MIVEEPAYVAFIDEVFVDGVPAKSPTPAQRVEVLQAPLSADPQPLKAWMLSQGKKVQP